MAEKPISTPLPADLPTNWQTGQTVSPTGTEVGLTQQHGYNYQSQQINNAQTAINTINEAFENVYGDGDTIPISDGGTGANNSNDARQNLGAAPGRNLIRNWYFVGNGIPGQFPVNRNGNTNYSRNGISIDGWTLSNDTDLALQSANIKIWGTDDPPGSGNRVAFYQTIPGDFDNQEVTLSVLINGAAGSWYCQTNMGGQTSAITGPAGGPQLYSSTFTVQQRAELQVQIVKSSLSVNDYIEIIAIKLEFGPVQTLARQDESGDWILNDTPDYAEQYTICEQYSPIDGSFVGSQHSNPNLLDNWYFVGGGSQQGGGQFPINQRGQTSYTGEGYGIDRWTKSAPSCAVNINSSGVSFSSTSEDGFMAQFIENPKVIHGKITLSVLSESSNVYATARIIVFYNGAIADLVGERSNLSICSINLDDYDNITNIEFRIGNLSTGQSTTLIAAKLELGPVQTLAHQDAEGNWVLNDPPPNFQQELVKCQRYQLVLRTFPGNYMCVGNGKANTTANCFVFIPIPVLLRTLPTISYSGNLVLFSQGAVSSSSTTVTALKNPIVSSNGITLSCASSGLIAGESYQLWGNIAETQIIFDANL